MGIMATEVDNLVYVHLDGDGIGDRLELYFLDNEIADAQRFSDSVNRAMGSIRDSIQAIEGAQVLIAGGDDLVAAIPSQAFVLERIEELGIEFLKCTGCTLSGGVGASVEAALNGLRRAKLSGKNKILWGK